MTDNQTNAPPPPKQLNWLGRLGKGIFRKPSDSQTFEVKLDKFETGFKGLFTYAPLGYDKKRSDIINDLKIKIANAITDYLTSYGKNSPITIKKYELYNDAHGMDEPFIKALTSITITKYDGTITTYYAEDLKYNNNYLNDQNQLSFYLLTKAIYESVNGGIVGPEKATLRIELDMSKLVEGTNGGRRRSSRKIVRKMRKRNSRAKTRNYRTRK